MQSALLNTAVHFPPTSSNFRFHIPFLAANNDAIITASNSGALMANYRFCEQNQIELDQTCHKPTRR